MPDICGIMRNSQYPITALEMGEQPTCLPQRRVAGDIVRTAFQSKLLYVYFWQDLPLHLESCTGRLQKSLPVGNGKNVNLFPILNQFWKNIRIGWRISLGGVGRFSLTFDVNFINILHVHFLYESVLRIVSLITVWLSNFLFKDYRHKICS